MYYIMQLECTAVKTSFWKSNASSLNINKICKSLLIFNDFLFILLTYFIISFWIGFPLYISLKLQTFKPIFTSKKTSMHLSVWYRRIPVYQPRDFYFFVAYCSKFKSSNFCIKNDDHNPTFRVIPEVKMKPRVGYFKRTYQTKTQRTRFSKKLLRLVVISTSVCHL